MDDKVDVNILVVDDNPENLKVMEFTLESEDYHLVKAQSGEEALKALLYPEDFALIFMDVRMPGLDGFDAAAMIRQRDRCSQIPIIFLTAYSGNESSLFKGYSLGAVDFLMKPIAPEILKSKVAVFVDLYKKNKKLMLQEELLLQSHDELENRVKDRTSELRRANDELTQEIAERQRVEFALKESLKEKEVLLREIHHRVKNNLQIVSSILSLQGQHIPDEKSLEMFEEAQGRIRSIALIHELLYRKGDLASIDFKEYLQELVSNLLRAYHSSLHVDFDIQVDSSDLDLDLAIHCGLIATELITNSLKYGFKDRETGLISLGLSHSDGKYYFSIADNGVGLPAHIDLRQTNTLGLQLVATISDQIDAKVKIENRHGAQFQFVFPDHRLVRSI